MRHRAEPMRQTPACVTVLQKPWAEYSRRNIRPVWLLCLLLRQTQLVAQQLAAQTQLKYESQTWLLAQEHEAEEAEEDIEMVSLEHFVTQPPGGPPDF